MRMTLVRTVTISGFAGDANPNVTPPAAGTTFKMQNVPGDQMKDERVEGHRIAIRFVDNANAEVVGPTVDFRTWAKDEDMHPNVHVADTTVDFKTLSTSLNGDLKANQFGYD